MSSPHPASFLSDSFTITPKTFVPAITHPAAIPISTSTNTQPPFSKHLSLSKQTSIQNTASTSSTSPSISLPSNGLLLSSDFTILKAGIDAQTLLSTTAQPLQLLNHDYLDFVAFLDIEKVTDALTHLAGPLLTPPPRLPSSTSAAVIAPTPKTKLKESAQSATITHRLCSQPGDENRVIWVSATIHSLESIVRDFPQLFYKIELTRTQPPQQHQLFGFNSWTWMGIGVAAITIAATVIRRR